MAFASQLGAVINSFQESLSNAGALICLCDREKVICMFSQLMKVLYHVNIGHKMERILVLLDECYN